MADIQVANTDSDLSGNTLVTEENAYTITGLHTFSRSTNAPFAVVSGAAVVANLDADALTGQHGSYYLAAAHVTGTLAVANGGTGATSLTDGGVLLGSGTGAITALAVLTDGQMIVGDGSGDPVAESGATLRTSIGVGTGDSPTFTGLTVSGTGASALDVGGGLNIGTGNVALVGTDGKINGPLSSTIIDDLSGANLNSLNMDSVSSGTLAVARGGTGATTLTDGGVLLGSGTGAISATAVLTDGQMIVGDGTGAPSIESGSTLRTSIGVGTGDSPTFTGLTVSGTGAAALDVGGGLNIGTGNVSLVGTDGKLEGPLSSTIIDDLSGANLTSLNAGNISSGTLAVARGGTGATSLTDGGILMGGGTGAITATSVLTDGQMIVGDGSGDPALESGATLRTSIGVGTGDEPEFQKVSVNTSTNNAYVDILCDTGAQALYVREETSGEINAVFRGGNDGATVNISCQNDSGSQTASIANNGNLSCNVLSKASGSFRIPHPHPSKTATHDLVHSFVESNRAGLVYDGEVDLVAGAATIDMDELVGMTSGTWVLLTRDPHVFTSNETGWSPVRGTVSGATLTIECQDNTSTDTVSYMVVAERQDAHMTSADTEWTDNDGRPIIEPLQEVEE